MNKIFYLCNVVRYMERTAWNSTLFLDSFFPLDITADGGIEIFRLVTSYATRKKFCPTSWWHESFVISFWFAVSFKTYKSWLLGAVIGDIDEQFHVKICAFFLDYLFI